MSAERTLLVLHRDEVEHQHGRDLLRHDQLQVTPRDDPDILVVKHLGGGRFELVRLVGDLLRGLGLVVAADSLQMLRRLSCHQEPAAKAALSVRK
jgi:hypothetical protein